LSIRYSHGAAWTTQFELNGDKQLEQATFHLMSSIGQDSTTMVGDDLCIGKMLFRRKETR